MDTLTQGESWRFDVFLLDPQRRGLFRLDSKGVPSPVAVGGRALDVLLALLARAGEITTKQQIMDAVWPGLAVEEKNLTVQISALRRELDQGRVEGSCIQTVTGRGYRMAVPVTRLSVPVASTPAEAPAGSTVLQPIAKPPSWMRWRNLLGLGVVILGFAIAYSGIVRRSPSNPPRLSIVVLPFDNLSRDPAQDYLADGITEDLTTDLAHIPGVLVIARNSAFSYKGKAIGLRRIGAELGVRYALEGSVRRTETGMRVNVQLVSTETDSHLWSDRFDVELGMLDAGEDDIVRRITSAMGISLVRIEAARSQQERANNPDATDLLLRARALYSRGVQAEAEEVVRLAERAAKLDPSSAHAWALLVSASLDRVSGDYDPAWITTMARVDAWMDRAEATDPNNLFVMQVKGYLLRVKRRCAEAVGGLKRAIELYPNGTVSYVYLAQCLINLGRPVEAIPLLEWAMRLSPLDTFMWNRYARMSLATGLLGRYQESLSWAERSLAAFPAMSGWLRADRYAWIAAAHEILGRPEQARAAVAEIVRATPAMTVRSFAEGFTDNTALTALAAPVVDALRRAGLRDHADEDADFGLPADAGLSADRFGRTPTTVIGAHTIRTPELRALLAERKPVVIDTDWGASSIPGAIGLVGSGASGSFTDAVQDHLRRKMQELTGGDLSRPVVTVAWNAERSTGRNLALRLVALGYIEVNWYRGGNEAWQVAGLPETPLVLQDW